jgi:formylglycine-generating enzyme required for sulfatase activity
MPLVDPTFPAATGALLVLAFGTPFGAIPPSAGGSGGNVPNPAVQPPAQPNATATSRGLQSVARSQTGGQTMGDLPPNMVLVPGGTFTMGIGERALIKWLESDSDTRNTAAHLLVACTPEHTETASDLLVDKGEVSNLQYKTWLDAHNKAPDPYTIKYNWIYFKNGKAFEGIPPEQEHHPIRAISCDEARACATWLGKRVPTEVEWAYIASRGLKPDQAYPWGAGIGEWDPKKCANSSNSSRGPQGPQSFAPGSWKDDCTVDGVFDMCGNVGEWTVSPFLAYPGFTPVEIGDKKTKRLLRGNYSAEFVAVRGGSYFGNHITNNNFWREGQHPGSRFEGVGFRGVMSAIPGLDQLNDAQRMLTMIAGDFKGRLDLSPQGVAGQVVQYHDPETGVGRGSKHLAFTKVTSILAPLLKVEKDSVEKPVLLGIFTTSTPIAKPQLPPGSYGVYFKGKGESADQKLAREAARKNDPKAADGGGEKPDAKGDAKRREADRKREAERKKEAEKKDAEKKDGKKDDPKSSGGGAGKPGEPKDGEGAPESGADAEKPEGEKSAEELAAEKADADAKKAMEEIGLGAKEVSLVDIPTDRAVLLIKNEAGATVAVLDAKFVDGQPLHPTRFTYAPGGVGGPAAKASAAKAGSGMIVAPHDSARFVFSMKMGTGTKFPEFDLEFLFEAGSFEPVTPAGK